MNCPPGKEYDVEKKRCYKICKHGTFRNPTTKRCIKDKAQLVCPEGKEKINGKCYKICPPKTHRNAVTKRCRKVREPKEKVKKTRKQRGRKGDGDLLEGYSDTPERIYNEPEMYPECVTNSKIPLYPHQLRLVTFLSENRGVIAIHDVGTGKTLTAVTAGQCFLNESALHSVIVVTPVSLQKNFIQTLTKYGVKDNNRNRFKFYTIQGFTNAKKKGSLHNLQNSMLILDEAHNIRTAQQDTDGNLDGNRVTNDETVGIYAKSLIDVAKIVKRVLLLTATPMINTPKDMINLIAIVNGEQQIVSSDFNGLDFKRWLRAKVSIYSPSEEFRAEKFPRSVYNDVFIKMNPEYYRAYMRVQNMPTASEQAFFNGLRQYSNTLNHRLYPKASWIINKIENSQPDDKFVVFSHYLKSGLEIVMKLLKQLNIPYLYVTGSLSKEDREHAVREYNANNIKVLLISKAGGEGLDLKNTTDIILMDPAWNESANRQVIGRGVRLESHHSLPVEKRVVNIYRLFMIKPEEERNVNTICNELLLTNGENGVLSIDLLMRNMSMLKQIKIDEFMEFMKRYSIEKYNLADIRNPPINLQIAN